MKIKGKLHLKWCQDRKGCLHTVPGEVKLQEGLMVNYRPQQKIVNRKELPMVGPNVKDIHRISHKKPTTSATQPMWNQHWVFSDQLLFKTTLPNFLHFLHKITFWISFVGLAYGFCYSFAPPELQFFVVPK